jgi:PAS domain S-box-containing protein
MSPSPLHDTLAGGLLAALDEHAIVSVADVQGNITYVNEKFCQISGYAAHELVGRNHRLLKSGVHEAALYEAMWARIASGQTWRGEVCNRRKSGELYWVEATITPELDSAGLPCRYVSIRTDISATKRAQHRAEHAEAQLALFRHAVESTSEGVALCDTATHQLSYLNPAAQAILGWPGDSAIGKSPMDLVPGHAKVPFGAVVERALQGQDAHIDYAYLRPDGVEVPLRNTLTPVRDESGRVSHLVNVFGDRSEELERQHQLQLALDEARRANRAKAEFMSRMSHELRTPLNAILGFAQVLLLQRSLDTAQADSAREILNAGKHLLALIDDVLDTARIDLGTLRVSLEPVRLDGLLAQAMALLGPQAQHKGMSLSHEVASGLTVVADHLRLKQCLINLMSNALKYNRPGGYVRVAAKEAPGGRVRIEIEDGGQGLAAQELERLFQPFHRLERHRDSTDGIGIGLSITLRLVKLMDGEICVHSQPGVGSVFWIELRQAERQPGPPAEESSFGGLELLNPARRASRKLVLYVEDNPANQKLVRAMLGMLPEVTVLCAGTAAEGLACARAESPDLILLDIGLPDMSGHELLAVLRREPALARTPAIAISANAMPADVAAGHASGFDDYLTKPINVHRMLDRVSAALALQGPAS